MTEEPRPAPTKDKTRLVSLAEASETYGFDQDYLGELARKGRLQAHKSGGVWLTTPAAIEAYIRSRKRRGAFRHDIQA